ncbi:hypothetical protein [Paraliomyxa miuraensis]|uniref:hypothetical protein n=1 Tax=Paraliomyxa miuraensis TaxID=376150 RepID=UPI002250934B|nr:hypothetical protein [Paraliomyxa miuraensis]MCX4241185.1 hypothetical protein [Paraliomyxa miuraensis]
MRLGRLTWGAGLVVLLGLTACPDDPAGTGTESDSEGSTGTTTGPVTTDTFEVTSTSSSSAVDSTGTSEGSTTDETTGSTGEPPPARGIAVGAAVVTLLPEVEGSTAYADPLRNDPPLALDPGDPGLDPGVFVEQWDVGTIAIGNGYPTSHWVHDEIRAHAVAFTRIDDDRAPTLVLVTADVYMLFAPGIASIKDKVLALVGQEAFDRLEIVISATHNHMGPDTSGLDGINHEYYEYMTDQIALAIADAVDPAAMRPATLLVASSDYQFGTADGTTPRIVDPTLNTLQAVDRDDPSQVLATVVQWQSHPEDTLFFGDDVAADPAQAGVLQAMGECHSEDGGATCHIEGQYISAGFSGYTVRYLMEQTGAPAMVIEGPVGHLQSPLFTLTWETEGPTAQPPGDGQQVPAGADVIPRNFHRMAVNGLELGRRVLADLQAADTFDDGPIEVRRQPFYSRLANLGFRIGLLLDGMGQVTQLGHLPRELYTCPPMGPKDDATCVSDGFMGADLGGGLVARVGDHLRSEVVYVHLGPIEMLSIPGEAAPELVHGLPMDFVADPAGVYYPHPEDAMNHMARDQYVTPGYVRQMLTEPYRWSLGLTEDAMGYIFPMSDWRLLCIADIPAFGGVAGLCDAMGAAGILDGQDPSGAWWITGQRCKEILDDPTLLGAPPYTDVPGGDVFAALSCQLGQVAGEPADHYEETVAVGWDIAADWVEAARLAAEYEGAVEQVNPGFVGYNVIP